MTRIAFSILISFSTFGLFAQIEKGSMIISLNGSYLQTNTGEGVTKNYMNTQGKYLSVGTSFEYLINGKFAVGLGLDYKNNKELVSSIFLFSDLYLQYEKIEYKTKAFVPNFYLSYYQQLVKNLYFNASFKISYSKYYTEYEGDIISASRYVITNDTSSTRFSFPDTLSALDEFIEKEAKFDFFGVRICPEIIYFINKNIGLYIDLGEISYSVIDWETEKSLWLVDFNPYHWKLGVKYRF
jgi:hypothetical protein